MADSIILLEERKEVTTFLLDEGTITETTVTTPTGETPSYDTLVKRLQLIVQ